MWAGIKRAWKWLGHAASTLSRLRVLILIGAAAVAGGVVVYSWIGLVGSILLVFAIVLLLIDIIANFRRQALKPTVATAELPPGGHDPDGPLQIWRAEYGALEIPSLRRTVTQRVRAHVRDGRLDVYASNDHLLGGEDPAPMHRKALELDWSYDGSPQRNGLFIEGSRVILPSGGEISPLFCQMLRRHIVQGRTVARFVAMTDVGPYLSRELSDVIREWLNTLEQLLASYPDVMERAMIETSPGNVDLNRSLAALDRLVDEIC